MTELQDRLLRIAQCFGTPAYVYDVELIAERAAFLESCFSGLLEVSYAVKANPNVELLRRILPHVATLDVSSYGEVRRALAAGCAPERLTFSGPAKRPAEIHGAVCAGVGELVLESWTEAERADQAAAELGRRQPVLVRINPVARPRRVGVSFSGRASQFGFDEEVLEETLDRLAGLRHLDLAGFHIFSGVNSLDPEAIAENFQINVELFRRACAHARLAPRKLVFGSGFGLPYAEADAPLDIEAVARGVRPLIAELKAEPPFARAACMLELGRWLVGPAGWLLTSVVSEKASRGVEFRACDAGFNNHLAAFGMMGTVIRRNWRLANLSNPAGEARPYTLVGPLCTSIDVLATEVSLPAVRLGDVIAVENSGAYGLTASPTRFISHPEPAELLLDGAQVIDASEPATPLARTPAEPAIASRAP